MLKLNKPQLWIFLLFKYVTLVQCLDDEIEIGEPVTLSPKLDLMSFNLETLEKKLEDEFNQMKKEFQRSFDDFPFDLHKLPEFMFESNEDENKPEIIEMVTKKNDMIEPEPEMIQLNETKVENAIPEKAILTFDSYSNDSKNALNKSLSFHANVKDDSHEMIDDFINSFKLVMDYLKDFSLPHHFSTPSISNKARIIGDVKIEINDHGKHFSIPKNALLKEDQSGLINITWRSDSDNVNNSLSFKMFTDLNQEIVLRDMHLIIVKGNETEDYLMDKRVHLSNSTEEHTVVKLNNDLGVNFPNMEFIDLIDIRRNDNFSNGRFLIYMAMIGLLTVVFFSLVIYWIHKNKMKAKESNMISKVPLA